LTPPDSAVPTLAQRLGRRFRRILPLDWSGLSLSAGLRAACAVAVPVFAGEFLDVPALSWIAIVAFWGCLVDPGGAWRERFVALAAFTVLASLGTLLALLAQAHLATAILLAAVWCFLASFARVFGAAATSVGLLLCTDMLVGLGIPTTGTGDLIQRPVLTLIGGCWAMLLVLIFWRLYPNGPARRAVGRCWQALGDYAEALGRLHDPRLAEPSRGDWGEVTRRHRKATREAIEQARGAVAAIRRQSGGKSGRVHAILGLLMDLERGFDHLIALSELLEIAQPTLSSEAGRAVFVVLSRIGRDAHAIAESLGDSRPHPARGAGDAADLLRRRVDMGQSLFQTILHLVADIVAALESAKGNSAGVRSPETLVEAMAIPAPQADGATIGNTIRDNLQPDSLVLRHALRIALTAGIAEAIVSYLALPRGYWLTMTAVVTLQPFLATTWRRTLERVTGSVLGGSLAAVISIHLASPIAVTALVVPLSVVTMAIRNVNYTLFVFCLTPQFILIAELFQPGSLGSWHLALLRASHSAVGGALALISAFLLWPGRERPYLRRRLADMVEASAAYVMSVLRGQAADAAVQAMRRKTGLACNNAEASIERLAGEPRSHSDHLLEPAMSLVICCRRLGGAIAAIRMARRAKEGDPGPAAPMALLDWIDAGLRAAALELTSDNPGFEPAPPDVPERQWLEGGNDLIRAEIQEIIRQIETLREAASRVGTDDPAEIAGLNPI
jgi:uncharacterized membrane protein YccC